MKYIEKTIKYGNYRVKLKISYPDGITKRIFIKDFLEKLNVEIASIENIASKKFSFNDTNTSDIDSPNILVLFLKKETASPLIGAILKEKRLPIGMESQLFVNTLKMWVGSKEAYEKSDVKNEFSKPEDTESFAKEYDYIALRFTLPNKRYTGYKKNEDSYERKMFFKQICTDGISLNEYSKTLSFDNGISKDVYEV